MPFAGAFMAITAVPVCIVFAKQQARFRTPINVLIDARNIFFIRQPRRSQTTLGTGTRQPAE